MIGAAAVASAAVALAAPAPATLHADLGAAASYWQQAVPSRCSTETVSYAKLPGRELGEATIPNPLQSEPCMMAIESGLTGRQRCLTVVHEFGHWLGLEHSKDIHSPMFPVIGGAVVPQCEHI